MIGIITIFGLGILYVLAIVDVILMVIAGEIFKSKKMEKIFSVTGIIIGILILFDTSFICLAAGKD